MDCVDCVDIVDCSGCVDCARFVISASTDRWQYLKQMWWVGRVQSWYSCCSAALTNIRIQKGEPPGREHWYWLNIHLLCCTFYPSAPLLILASTTRMILKPTRLSIVRSTSGRAVFAGPRGPFLPLSIIYIAPSTLVNSIVLVEDLSSRWNTILLSPLWTLWVLGSIYYSLRTRGTRVHRWCRAMGNCNWSRKCRKNHTE